MQPRTESRCGALWIRALDLGQRSDPRTGVEIPVNFVPAPSSHEWDDNAVHEERVEVQCTHEGPIFNPQADPDENGCSCRESVLELWKQLAAHRVE